MLKPLILTLLVTWPFAGLAQTALYMAEEDGCYWCEAWNEDIAHIYPKTVEGETAPLKRFDLHHETPDVAFKTRVRYTPTFILVKDGKELDRIEGYPGEDFFWALLSQMFERAGIPLDNAS